MRNYVALNYAKRRKAAKLNTAGEILAVVGIVSAMSAGVIADSVNMVPWAVLMGIALVSLGSGCYLTGRYGGKR